LKKWRGVNLGDWLVLEKWMDPAMFAGTDAADETWLTRLLSPEELSRRLRAHRETYVTEADFRELAARGFNLVRIPVPYFIFGDCPPYGSCIEFLDRAFAWAEKYGLKILVDLHTTPGCQNGYDNGGLVGVCRWHRDPDGVRFALSVLERLARRYGSRNGLFGIEAVNEPVSWLVYITAPTTGKARDKAEVQDSGYVPMKFLKAYYREVYRRLRAILPEEKAIVFHDGFRLTRWRDFFQKNRMENVYLDTHIYLWAMEMYLPLHCPWGYRLYLAFERARVRMASRYAPVLVGEWSLANHWACSLSRHRVIRRFRGSDEERIRRQRCRFREVAEMELRAFSDAAGWCYWSYQLLRGPEGRTNRYWKDSWDLTRCFRNRWVPEDMAKRG
jgi:glucan 1,3-beta-glucosidase